MRPLPWMAALLKGALGFSSEERRTRNQSKGRRRLKRKIGREEERGEGIGSEGGGRGLTWSQDPDANPRRMSSKRPRR